MTRVANCQLEGCGLPIVGRGRTARFCSPQHEQKAHVTRQVAKRLAQRQALRDANKCVDCDISLGSYSIITKRCASCSSERDRIRARASQVRRRAAAGMRPRSSVERPKDAEEQRRLRHNAERRELLLREKKDRVCVGCSASLASHRRDTQRCKSCASAHSTKTRQKNRTIEAQRRVVFPPKPKEKAKRNTLKRVLTAPTRPKPPSLKPNLQGDWFPGWTGCYPPNRTALEIELLEGGKGRPVFEEAHQVEPPPRPFIIREEQVA